MSNIAISNNIIYNSIREKKSNSLEKIFRHSFIILCDNIEVTKWD